MKPFIYCLIVCLAGGVLAEDISTSNLIGLLPVTSTAKRTIVAVPWCAMSATDDSAIQVSNLVKTANLTVGDQLHYVNSDGSYLSWRLAEGAGGVKFWQSVIIATDKSVTVSPNAHDQTVARGNSIVLIRQDVSNPTFYLYGQVGTNSNVTTSVAVGSASAPAYTLIASPSVSAWKVNDIAWTGVSSNDFISITLGNGYQKTLKPGLVGDPAVWKWGSMVDVYDQIRHKKTGEEWTEYATSIPAGQGVWYISYGGNPTISWTGVPVK